MGNFGEWLQVQLQERGWNQAELARRANVTDATLSRIISGTRQPGPDVTLSIARALQLPPERVFRAAALLPPVPPPVEEEHEALALLRSLPATVRRLALTVLRALAREEGIAAGVAEPLVPYTTEDEAWIREVVEEVRQVPEGWRAEAVRQIRFVARMANRPDVRMVGEDEEERAADSAS